jgi:phospholipid/cholesterol/gamma-HCH transport system permease protein
MSPFFLDQLGQYTIVFCSRIGRFSLFFTTTILTACGTKLPYKKIFEQMEHIGIHSISIAVLTGAFTGAVLALQSQAALSKFGGEEFVGALVGVSMVRELGPVLSGLMVTGRAGSAMAAELSTMRITEQIDALHTLNINPFTYLIIPRIFAGFLILPCVSLIASLCGILGGYCIWLYVFELQSEVYYEGIKKYIEFSDIFHGLLKASIFGLIIAFIGCYKGYYASGGARGVGIATTQAVVVSSIFILLANYFLALLFFT